ncbi:hypothetical protein KUTeg_013452 [Tegillarca granosa]|uniref:C-type lectin domain-containing protein n=1 Tax=Tegillarca granosa TaxID=220873 RepID=A0ABQ9EZ50_TEGGR|nr:hypothetical protein KUTeg_013452 [Tegillarca granosa]
MFVSCLFLEDADYWIGGSDWTVEGEWLWEPDGIPMTYTDWYPGQPNNGMAANAFPFAAQQEHQNCLAMLYDHKYKWIDSNCDDYKHTICEKRAVVPVTTPGFTDIYSTMKTTTTTPTTRTTTSSTTMTTTETPSTYTTAPPTTSAPTPRPTTPKEVVETQTPTTVKETPVMTTTMKQTTPEETMPKETTTTTMKTTTTEQEFVLIGRGIL